jgi:hypothetical protein
MAFLAWLGQQGQFSVGALKRRVKELWFEELGVDIGQVSKPSALEISQMWDPKLCVPGDTPLPASMVLLDVDAMDKLHQTICVSCQDALGGLDPGCYWSTMRRCVTHGWKVPARGPFERAYGGDQNNRRSDFFPEAFGKGVASFLDEGVAMPLDALGLADADVIINPMGIVLRSSDLAKARLLTKVKVVDQPSLDAANSALTELGLKPIKVRISTNASAPGINRALYTPRFSYATVGDALNIIQRGDTLGKGDVERYFLNFGFASAVWSWFGARAPWGSLFAFVMVFFGLASAPYYTSVWGAEFRAWALGKGVNCVHMVDDWLVSERTEIQARESMSIIVLMLVSIGLSMADHKFDFGTRVVFLGIVIDTITMTLAFDKVSAQVLQATLAEAEDRLRKGQPIPYTDVMHIAGKLNWFAAVLQSGRVHTASWWALVRFSKSGLTPSQDVIDAIIADNLWWSSILCSWEAEAETKYVFPILSSAELRDRPDLVYVIVSDSSGDDAFGYFHGVAANGDPAYTSVAWPPGFKPPSSMNGELLALLHFVSEMTLTDCLLVWVSDSLSGVQALNAGRAKQARDLEIISGILGGCDEARVAVVGLWVPREENTLADYLSHLAVYLGVERVDGDISDLFC